MKRKLAVVFDFDDFSNKEYRLFINAIRGTLRNLGRHFSVVKILVTNPPTTADLEIQESEILLEYDTERQGLR